MSVQTESSGFEGRLLNQRWRVADAIGSGTFGVVHRGEGIDGAPVAIKLLHPQFLHHVETIARFWNEAEALRRLNHPNVLFLLDVGMTEDGVPFLVTELLTGETLRDLLDREGALPPDRAMRLLGPAAHALHHAHMQVVAAITRKKFISEMDLLRLQKALLMCRMAADSTFLVDKE
ncbi:MAG: protein kinase, partial [Polyangiales bacterium]